MKANSNSIARFDTRLSKEQKDFFEYAASLGGFRTLTEFVIFSVQEKAKKIVADHNTLLESKKDKEIFFNALINASEPNTKLKDAAKRYKEVISKLK